MSGKGQVSTTTNVLKGVSIFLGLVVLGIIIESIAGGKVYFDQELKAEDYAGMLSHIAFVALITERFVEIFTSVIRKPDRVILEHELENSSGDSNKRKARKTLDEFKSKTEIFAITISFITGLIIAAVGVRLLGQLFDTNELPRFQSLCFGAVDIVVTAGIIAGGSKGINAMTSSVGAVFDAMKYQSRANEIKAKKSADQTT